MVADAINKASGVWMICEDDLTGAAEAVAGAGEAVAGMLGQFA